MATTRSNSGRLHVSTDGRQQEHEQRQKELSNQTEIYGGEYAGLSATFSPTSGELIPVPEYYVPESMVEWGQIPSCFEVIVSEECLLKEGENNGRDDGEYRDEYDGASRWTVQVMPEVGCGLDNLDTMKTQKYISFDKSSSHGLIGDRGTPLGISVSSVFINDENRVECIFTVENSNVDKDKDGENDSDMVIMKRTRIGINLFPNNQQIKSPIEIVKERKVSNKSSGGTIADGGGLDARTVSRLVGQSNSNRPFSEGKGIDLEKDMVGLWTVHKNSDRNKSDETIEVDRDVQYWGDNDDHTKTLSLPGNVIIRYSGSPLSILEISFVVNLPENHGATDEKIAEQENGIEQVQLRRAIRVVMKRQFNYCPKSEKNLISNAEYYWEERV